VTPATALGHTFACFVSGVEQRSSSRPSSTHVLSWKRQSRGRSPDSERSRREKSNQHRSGLDGGESDGACELSQAASFISSADVVMHGRSVYCEPCAIVFVGLIGLIITIIIIVGLCQDTISKVGRLLDVTELASSADTNAQSSTDNKEATSSEHSAQQQQQEQKNASSHDSATR